MNRQTAIHNLTETLTHNPGITFFEDRSGHAGNHRIEVRGNNNSRYSINFAMSAIVLALSFKSKRGHLHYQDFLFLDVKTFYNIFTTIEDKSGEPIWPEWWEWMEVVR